MYTVAEDRAGDIDEGGIVILQGCVDEVGDLGCRVQGLRVLAHLEIQHKRTWKVQIIWELGIKIWAFLLLMLS